MRVVIKLNGSWELAYLDIQRIMGVSSLGYTKSMHPFAEYWAQLSPTSSLLKKKKSMN